MEQQNDEPPFWQKMFDNPWLLLFLGIGVMAVFYTGWGFVEVLSLPQATLP